METVERTILLFLSSGGCGCPKALIVCKWLKKLTVKIKTVD